MNCLLAAMEDLLERDGDDDLNVLAARGVRRRRKKGIVTPHRACGSRWPIARRMQKISYNGYRFPPEIIQQAIWLYLRFTLSLRDVEDLLAEREWRCLMRPFGVG